MHYVLSGKAVTGVCTFYNKTPVNWYCKQQSTSETATYGAEFLSVRKWSENIIDHKTYLRYLGKPVHDMNFVWGNNESMINSSTVPVAKLHKRHNILLFHFVRRIVAQGYINMLHIASKYNFADILTKHWSYQGTYCKFIQSVFHHEGNTVALFLDNTLWVDASIIEEEGTRFSILGMTEPCLKHRTERWYADRR